MIKISKGGYHYNGKIGIHDINLTINQGEAICIMGPNGAGKSTLLKIIVGLYPLESGKYCFNGVNIDQEFLKDQKKVGKFYQQFGFVFQNCEIQLFNMNVYDEIAFGLRNLGLDATTVEQRTMDCLHLLKIERLKDRVPYHLSGGEQKLVAIASVLVMNPNIIILDEPFNGLSPKYRNLITKIINQLRLAGKTIIISSHHLNQVRNLVDKLYFFSEDHTIEKEVTVDKLESVPNFNEYLDSL